MGTPFWGTSFCFKFVFPHDRHGLCSLTYFTTFTAVSKFVDDARHLLHNTLEVCPHVMSHFHKMYLSLGSLRRTMRSSADRVYYLHVLLLTMDRSGPWFHLLSRNGLMWTDSDSSFASFVHRTLFAYNLSIFCSFYGVHQILGPVIMCQQRPVVSITKYSNSSQSSFSTKTVSIAQRLFL